MAEDLVGVGTAVPPQQGVVDAHGPEPQDDKLERRSCLLRAPEATEDLVDEIYWLSKTSRAASAWRSWQRSEIFWDGLHTNFVDRLHEVTVPTLILHGAEDRFVPVAWARRAHQMI